MATRVLKAAQYVFKGSSEILAARNSGNVLTTNINCTSVRHRVTTETGAFLPQPQKTPFGVVRVLLTVLPGLYLGATISKEGAAFLEENDIFVPDDDDDED